MRRTDFIQNNLLSYSTANFTILAINFINNIIRNKLPNKRISTIIFGDDEAYAIEMTKVIEQFDILNETTLRFIDELINLNMR